MRDYFMPETPITDAMAVTNADRIRAMSDEELAKLIYGVDGLGWCKEFPECIEQVSEISEEKCIGCALAWLQEPVGGEGDG